MIAEYIIVDIRTRRLARHRDPLNEKFQTVDEFGPGQSFTLLRFPDVEFDVAEFFRP